MENNLPKKKVFVLKMFGADLYRWSPIPTNITKKKQNYKVRPSFCSATPGSNGQDWNTTYVYNIRINKYRQERSAYVECDYVE
jgi:hypothetical protein